MRVCARSSRSLKVRSSPHPVSASRSFEMPKTKLARADFDPFRHVMFGSQRIEPLADLKAFQAEWEELAQMAAEASLEACGKLRC